jgi:23S rRNA (uracil1939-C5)-methyltransferase
VDLRAVADRVLLTLIVRRDRSVPPEQRTAIGERVRAACSQVAGVAWSLTAPKSPTLLGSEPETVAGASELVEEAAGTRRIATPGAFVQAHPAQAERIVQHIAEAFERRLQGLEGRRVLDVYGGSGAIGLALAARGAAVTLVESHASAVRAAARAGAPFGERFRAIALDASRFAEQARGEGFDAAVVNPPRRGIAPAIRAWLAGAVPLVAYVSCNPETFARDLADLAVRGLSAERVQPFDMIPLTEEVECVALLARGARPPPIVAYEDDELVVVDKPPHEPTTPQGEHAGSLLDRVRALPGCERSAPLHRLDVGTSGVCVFAKTSAAAGRWSPAIAAADKRYLALARGVWSARGVVHRALAGERSGRVLTTRYRRLEVTLGQSLLEVAPESGKKHQIRRHLAAIGHPLVGDARHGHAPTNRHFAERFGLDRTFLHCSRIEIAIPGGPSHRFEAKLAGDLASVLAHARGPTAGPDREG